MHATRARRNEHSRLDQNQHYINILSCRTPVYPHVNRIFTANSISLRYYMRQQRHCYSIHAGPHLTAKEFRYLRILIVKTVIDQRFHKYLDSYLCYTHDIGQDSAPIQHRVI